MPKEKKEVASSKLLKILRDRDVVKPVEPNMETEPAPIIDDIDDDSEDLIGMAPPQAEGTQVPPPFKQSKQETRKAVDAKIVDQVVNKKLAPQKKMGGVAGFVATLKQGVEKDRFVTGLVLDGGMVATATIEDRQGIKYLVDYSLTQILPEILNHDKKELEEIVSEICKTQLDREQKKGRSFFKLSGANALPGKIAVCFTESKTVTKDIELPDVSRKELKDVITWNATQNLPFSPDNVIIDKINQVGDQGNSGAEKHLLLGVAEPESLVESLEPLWNKNITPRKNSTAAYALWSSLVWNYPDLNEENTIVIHLGERTTTLLFVEENILRFVREFSLANEDLIKGLSGEITMDGKRVQITPHVAEAIKHQFEIPLGPGGGSSDDENTKLYFKIRPDLERLLTEINRSIGQYRRDFPIQNVKRIFFSHTSTTFSNLTDYLSESLAKPVLLLNPLRNLNLASGLNELNRSGEESVVLSTAIGLALNRHSGINLQPKNLQLEETFFVASNVLKRVAIFGFVILLTLSGLTKLNMMGAESKLSVAKNTSATLVPVKAEYEKLTGESDVLDNLIGLIDGDRNYFKNELTLLKKLSNDTPAEINLTLLRFQKGWEKNWLERTGRKYVERIDIEDPDKNYLRVQGAVGSNPVLRETLLNHLVESLRASKLIFNVTIVTKETAGSGAGESLVFTLKCFLGQS